MIADPAIDRFVAEATRFCSLLEERHPAPIGEIALKLQSRLLQLYDSAMALPDIGGECDGDDSNRLNHEWWQEFHKQTANWLGDEYAYRVAFDPLKLEESEAVIATLSDDLSDIYRDVKPGLGALQHSPNAIDGIVWEWRFGLLTHWGRHATGAIQALHELIVKESDES